MIRLFTVKMLLRSEEENPKCFLKGTVEIFCFWEEQGEDNGTTDQYTFRFTYLWVTLQHPIFMSCIQAWLQLSSTNRETKKEDVLTTNERNWQKHIWHWYGILPATCIFKMALMSPTEAATPLSVLLKSSPLVTEKKCIPVRILKSYGIPLWTSRCFVVNSWSTSVLLSSLTRCVSTRGVDSSKALEQIFNAQCCWS